MTRLLLHSCLFVISLTAIGQFSPPAGEPGSTAIQKDSTVFISWADGCEFHPGFINIADPESGMVSGENSQNATGIPDFQVVSLGDAGYAILTFEPPVSNGPGFDFAVFENSFSDDFLELAFVDVSSDGVNYFRFDAVSLTQTLSQVSSFGLLDATQINNLAGKYRGGFGVPFDLQELSSIAGLNVQKITHIKVTDVIGSIDVEYATVDFLGNFINDPWPTPFPSSGFDLDAIGVLHNTSNAGIVEASHSIISIYPNPADDYLVFSVPQTSSLFHYSILNAEGKTIVGEELLVHSGSARILVHNLPAGLYFISLVSDACLYTAKFVIK